MNLLQFPLDATCQEHGEAIAFADSGGETSYAELSEDVAAQSRAFLDGGIGPGDRIAFCPANDYQTLVRFWSLFSLGAVACPISPRFPEEERTRIAGRLGARWTWGNETQRLRRAPTSFDPDAAATITLSSGSTGEPQAIVHSLRAHVASAVGASSHMPLSRGDRWIWSLPSYHVGGLAIVIRCAVAGATVYGMHAADKLSADVLGAGRITHLSVVATQLRRLLREDAFPSKSLRAVLLGGSAVSPALVSDATERGVPVHTTYGLTEMASQVTASRAHPQSINSGRVLPYRELRIDKGEILVRGATLCLGYDVGGEVKSAVDRDGWFHTGDLGQLNEHGELCVSGRADNMFISGGENIYPEAIERAMLDLPDVEDAIVVAKADEEFGFRPIAFVRAEARPDSAWTAALGSKLRSFEMPIAFLPFPDIFQPGLKPSRVKLTEFVRTTSSNNL